MEFMQFMICFIFVICMTFTSSKIFYNMYEFYEFFEMYENYEFKIFMNSVNFMKFMNFVDLRGVHCSMCVIDLCCVLLICVLHCVAVVTGRDRFWVAVVTRRDRLQGFMVS